MTACNRMPSTLGGAPKRAAPSLPARGAGRPRRMRTVALEQPAA